MFETLTPLTRQLEELRQILLDLEVGKPLPPPTRMLRLVQDMIDDLNEIHTDIAIDKTAEDGYSDFIQTVAREEEQRRHKVVYLAGPYSHPDPAVRAERAQSLTEIAAVLTRDLGLFVISPITLGHAYALTTPDLPTDYQTHRPLCEALMMAAESMIIVDGDGARASVRVRQEAAFFQSLGRKVRVLVAGKREDYTLIPAQDWLDTQNL